jgi:hypothetical protein
MVTYVAPFEDEPYLALLSTWSTDIQIAAFINKVVKPSHLGYWGRSEILKDVYEEYMYL